MMQDTDRFAVDLPWGATLRPDGRGTRFRLWAPSVAELWLEAEGLAPLPMQPEGEGWFAVEAPCGAGTQYRFRLAPDLAVPDPASRRQAGDVHDPSVVVDPRSYAWRHAAWRGRPWHEAVVYELHAGLLGGFAGVARELPRLQELGVTAVELMPIADFPGPRNWGYDGVLPYAPDAAYGTPDELKALIDAAHGLGLMVFLDVVYNHFGPDGAYLHVLAKPFFDPARPTPWGPAIDMRRPEVAGFFEANALYWLNEYRFDGLRFDAVHAIAERSWLRRLAARIRAEIEPGRHVHLILENEANTAGLLRAAPADPGFDAQWNDDGHNALHVILTGEREGYYARYAEDAARKLATVLAEGFWRQGQTEGGEALHGEKCGHLPPTAFLVFLQNHDQIGNRAFGERLAALADPDALRAATALLLLGPQIPLLFMGEEWAAASPFLFFTSFPDPDLAKAVREGRRREFARFSAFADPRRRAEIPDPNAEETFLRSRPDPAEAAQAPHAETLALYRRLLALRHAEIVPRLPGARAIAAQALSDAAVLARWRLGDGTVLAIACNLGGEPAAARCRGRVLFESVPHAAAALAGGTLPRAAAVVLLEDEAG